MHQATKKNLFALIFLTVLFATQIHADKFYKWTDDSGNIHYADKAPIGVDSEAVDVKTQKPSKNSSPSPKFKAKTTKTPSNTENRKVEVAEYCDTVRKNIQTLETGGKIDTVDTDGSKRALNTKEQQAKLAKYKKQQSESCS